MTREGSADVEVGISNIRLRATKNRKLAQIHTIQTIGTRINRSGIRSRTNHRGLKMKLAVEARRKRTQGEL